MELHQLSEHCCYTDSDPVRDRPSFGYIRNGAEAFAVDSGNSPDHYREFIELLKAKGLPLPSRCLLTHSHWDHIMGIAAAKCLVLSSKKTYEDIRKMKEEGEEGLRRLYEENEYVRAEYASYRDIRVSLPDEVFEKEKTLLLNGLEVKAMEVNSPHCHDAVLIYIPEDGVIYAGDSSAGDFSTPEISYDRVRLKEYTDVVLSLDFSVFLHSHRQPLDYEGTKRFLKEARERGYYTF